MKKFTFILLITFSFSLFTSLCSAQYVDLYNFNGTQGAEPFGSLVAGPNGIFYGTAYLGGANDSGCIFSVDTNGNNYKDIFDFNGTNGKQPNSPLTIVNGTLFGSANGGGVHDSGLVFSIDTNGSNYKILYTFSGPDGKNPYNTLVFSSGTLYGVADGGLHHVGNIFSVDSGGGGFRDLFDFDTANGEYPVGIIMQGNKFYGMTLEGGAHLYGLIYSIDTNGTGYKDLYDFDNTTGLYPGGALTYGNGQLFGATSDGGLYGYGLLFSIDTNGSYPKRLFNFDYTSGELPEYAGGSLTLFGGQLYGEAYYGGAHDSGCIFVIDTTGAGYADVYDFTGPTGAYPEGSLTLYGNLLYGATASGGIGYNGVIFSFDTVPVTTATKQSSVASGQLSVYPNPNNGVFTIEFSHPTVIAGSQTIVEIYNEMGQKVTVATAHQVRDNNLIDLSSQPNGIYLYRVLDETGNLIGEGKVVVEK